MQFIVGSHVTNLNMSKIYVKNYSAHMRNSQTCEISQSKDKCTP